jgi:oxygen-dependent protoporphyrinogen oxidase
MEQKKQIAVVGAGIAGLTCAYTLKQAGYDVTVYEKESYVGGRMSSRKKDTLMFDIGANHLCNLYDSMKELTSELGIAFEPLEFVKYQVYKGGKVMPIKQSVSRASQLRLAAYFLCTSKKALLLDFFHLSSATQYDGKNAYEVLQKRLGTDAADYIIDPFCTTYQFHSAKEISMSVVRSIMGLLKFRYKEWYLYQTPRNGMIELPNALAATLHMQLSTAITGVAGGTHPSVSIGDTKQTFDAVVMAATASTTNRIYTNPTTEQSTFLSQVKYASSISVAFKVSQDLLPDTFIVWVPRIESATISGYTNEKSKGGQFVDNNDGTSLISLWLHEDYAKEIMHLSDEEIFAKTKTELLQFCPWFTEESELVDYDLHRWPEAMPKFYDGSVKTAATFMESHQGDNNVFFCGDYLNSPWTEGALRCGQRVAADVMKQLTSK